MEPMASVVRAVVVGLSVLMLSTFALLVAATIYVNARQLARKNMLIVVLERTLIGICALFVTMTTSYYIGELVLGLST